MTAVVATNLRQPLENNQLLLLKRLHGGSQTTRWILQGAKLLLHVWQELGRPALLSMEGRTCREERGLYNSKHAVQHLHGMSEAVSALRMLVCDDQELRHTVETRGAVPHLHARSCLAYLEGQ